MSTRYKIIEKINKRFDCIDEVLTSKDDTKIVGLEHSINDLYHNILVRLSKVPNYVFLLGDKMNYHTCGIKHGCDTNSYSYIKEKLNEGNNNYYPVGGYWFFGDKSAIFKFEHRWVYDKNNNRFIETTPTNINPICYAGVINFGLNDEIKNSNDVSEIPWFREQIIKTLNI